MRLLFPITLLLSCVSTLIISPLITPAPRLADRQAAENICGYYSLKGLISTISCAIGTPCLVNTYISPAVGYCGDIGDLPVTTIYGFGDWPAGGCGPGSACCPRATPDVGEYLFNGGATVLLGCGATPFTYSAFFSAEAGFAASSTPAAVQTPAVATAKATPLPGSTNDLASSNTPFTNSDPASTSTSPSPSQSATSSAFSSKTTTTIIVVAAAVAFAGGLVFLWVLYLAWKVHQTHKYPKQPQYSPLSYQASTASLHSGPPVKEKTRLSKWAKIATVISPIFAIIGLIVAIYFGLKPQKS